MAKTRGEWCGLATEARQEEARQYLAWLAERGEVTGPAWDGHREEYERWVPLASVMPHAFGTSSWYAMLEILSVARPARIGSGGHTPQPEIKYTQAALSTAVELPSYEDIRRYADRLRKQRRRG